MKSILTLTQRWKRSVRWRQLLTLVVVVLPVLLLQVGRYPLKVGQAQIEDESLVVPVRVSLLWKSVEVDVVRRFSVATETTQLQASALGYAAAYEVHSVIRLLALAVTATAFFFLRKQLPSIQCIRLPGRRFAFFLVAAFALISIQASWSGETDVATPFLAESRFLWVFAVSTLAISPVYEELYYRRFVQTALDSLHVPWFVSVMLVALYFGLSHTGTLVSALPLVTFGLVAGLAYQVTGKLSAAVALHVVLNVWSFVARLLA